MLLSPLNNKLSILTHIRTYGSIYYIVLKSAQHSTMRTHHNWLEQPFTDGRFSDCFIWLYLIVFEPFTAAFLMCDWTELLKGRGRVHGRHGSSCLLTRLHRVQWVFSRCTRQRPYQPIAQKRRLRLTGQGSSPTIHESWVDASPWSLAAEPGAQACSLLALRGPPASLPQMCRCLVMLRFKVWNGGEGLESALGALIPAWL